MLVSKFVDIKWNYRNRKHFESIGYKFTNINDVFTVDVNDLTDGSSVRVTLKCDYCGDEYECYYYSYVKSHKILNKDACRHCSCKKGKEANKAKRAKKYFTQLKEICDEHGYELITSIEEYTDVLMYIEYICPMHGLQKSILSNMIRGHLCNGCGNDKIGYILRSNADYVKEYIESFNGNILLNKEDYINSRTCNLKIKCGSCGNIFVTSLNSYRKKMRKQCPSCNKRESCGEETIRKFLLNNNIDFVQEKRFDDCRDIHALPFDFYLPKYNLCVEFDGEQHYRAAFGQDRYMTTKSHDEMKNKYCEDNNIYMLRIPYWEEDNIDEILANELNRIKIQSLLM